MTAIILYATRYGGTEKAVQLLRSRCPAHIPAVNVAKEPVPDLSSFDTVILGGPIYVGKMHTALANYMRQNSQELQKKRLALFICAGEQDPAVLEKEMVDAFPDELYRNAFAREVFGGELGWNKLDFLTKATLRLVKGIKDGYSRLSEARIDRFARTVFASESDGR